MKILFCVRHNFFSSPGGAQIQITKTMEYLKELNVECDITETPENCNFDSYDVVHLTDLTWIYDVLSYLKALKTYKGKIVLSTIYWPFDEYAGNGTPFFQRFVFNIFGINGLERVKAIGKFLLQRNSMYLKGVTSSYIKNQIKVVESVDLLLPNSELELHALKDRLSCKEIKYKVVNNAIDISVFKKILNSEKVVKDDKLITFVARIDPRKNQLNFLKAVYDTDYKIIFIGSAGPNSHGYYKDLKKMAEQRGNVEFVSHVSQEEVFSYMLKAKVNVLTSWIETPGLVSIEASYAECNIVVAEKGSVREYFKDYAFYCEPDKLKSILDAVVKASNSKFNTDILSLIENEYSWEYTAKQTLEAYKIVLNA